MNTGKPKYLDEVYRIKEDINNLDESFSVQGNIQCTCGSQQFYVYKNVVSTSENKVRAKKIQVIKDKYKNILNQPGNCLASRLKDGKEEVGYCNAQMQFFLLEAIDFEQNVDSPLVIKLKCAVCGKEYEIFNSSKHGYDGIISNKKYEGKIPMTKKRRCSSCNGETYQVELTISNTGKKDLMEEGGEYITEENWTTAFEWISVDLSCSTCGKKYKKWFDMETM